MSKHSTVDIHEAKTKLSKLVEQIESGARSEIVIARAGKPVARLVPIARTTIKLGIADGAFPVPDDIDALGPAIDRMFMPSLCSPKPKGPGTKRRS